MKTPYTLGQTLYRAWISDQGNVVYGETTVTRVTPKGCRVGGYDPPTLESKQAPKVQLYVSVGLRQTIRGFHPPPAGRFIGDTHKRFAHPTKEEALEALVMRKRSHVRHARKRLAWAEKAYKAAAEASPTAHPVPVPPKVKRSRSFFPLMLLLLALLPQLAYGTEPDPLDLAEDAVTDLDFARARALLDHAEAEGVEGVRRRRALKLRGLAEFYDREGCVEQALTPWTTMYREFPATAADGDIPPDALVCVGQAKALAQLDPLLPEPVPEPAPLNLTPAAPALGPVLFVTGGSLAAGGFGLSAGSYDRGQDLYPGLATPDGWDAASTEYRTLHTTERVGAALGATGLAVITAGIIKLIVDDVQRKGARR